MSIGPVDRDTDTDSWLTPTEVARRLQVNRRTVTRWAATGKLPCRQVGPHGHRRFRASVVAALSEGSGQVPPRLRRNGTSTGRSILRLVTNLDVRVERERESGNDDFSVALGDRLRAARFKRGWSLQDAATAAGHGLRPLVIGSYERAEQHITASRLATLAAAYGLTPAELLPPSSRSTPTSVIGPLTLAVDRLNRLPTDLAGPMSRYAVAVLEARGTPFAHRLTMRSSDVFVLAPALNLTPAGLIEDLDRWNVLVKR